MIRTLILAAGDGTRWKLHTGVPKHLVEVEGERLLDRTVRQFATLGEVEIVAPADHRYTNPAATTSPAKLDPRNGDADRFLSSRHRWDPAATMVLAFGDVWFSDQAADTIAEAAAGPDLAWVARFLGSKITGCDYGEGFAFVLPPGTHDRFEAATYRGLHLKATGQLTRALIGWAVWKIYAGLDYNAHETGQQKGAGLVEVDDWTEDFDFPEDFDRWVARRKADHG